MLSQRVRQLEPSPIFALDAKVKQIQAAGVPVISFCVGEPDFDTPESIRQAAIGAINEGFTHYTATPGILPLREAIAQKLQKENNINYSPAEIVVGTGSKQILYNAFQTLCDQGDEALIQTPIWSPYIEQIKLANAVPALMPLQPPFKLKASDIEARISSRTKVVLLNSPSNPTGAMIDASELEKIARLAVSRNIYIISDEIYEKITFGAKHISIASLGEDIKKLTVTINGFSKAYAMTGWRVGYGAGPKEIISAMSALQGQVTSNTCSISQKAAFAAISGDQSPVEAMRSEFEKRRQFVVGQLSQVKGLLVVPPEGAFYAFVGVESLLTPQCPTSQAWCARLLDEARVAVVPGEAFFAPGYFRLSFAASMRNMEEGISRIKAYLK